MNLALITSRALFSLILIIGLIYFIMYLLRRAMGREKRGFMDRRTFGIVGRIYLAPKKFIYLVRAGEKILVLGVGNEIHLLLIMKDDEITKSLRDEPGNSLGIRGFSEYLKRALSSKKSKI